MTSLLNGQAVKVRLGSIKVTCSLGSSPLSVRAQLAPPKPPPITTTLAADCANAGSGSAKDAAAAVAAPQNSRRVNRCVMPMAFLISVRRATPRSDAVRRRRSPWRCGSSRLRGASHRETLTSRTGYRRYRGRKFAELATSRLPARSGSPNRMPPQAAARTPQTPALPTPQAPQSRRRCATLSSASMSSASIRIVAGGTKAAASLSGEGDVLISERHRANPFARRREVGVEHRGRRDADGRLAYAAPEAAARHDDRFDLRHFVDPHRIVGIEILLLDAAILDGASAIEQSRQAIDERAGDLPLDLRRSDDVAWIGGRNNAMHLDLVAVGDRDFGGAGDIAGIAHVLGDAAEHTLRRRLAPADFLGDGIEHGKMFWMLRHQLAAEFDRILSGPKRPPIHEAFQR